MIRSEKHMFGRVRSQAAMDEVKTPLKFGWEGSKEWLEKGGVGQGVGISFYGMESLLQQVAS